ncbi:MAG: cytochrome c biogenesis CcdA family protein [Anaerolineae bacterium]
METLSASPFLAFGAGVLSFASPCVLPLVTAYVGYLGGRATAGIETSPPRWKSLLHGLFFVLGFSTIFVALGAAASGIGRLLFTYKSMLTQIGGVVVVVFGLHTLGLVKISFLYRDTRRHYRPRPELGYLSSALMGVFFGAGWSPCVGPTLGAILTLALSQATVGQGALLLLVYSMGLGIPFLFIALGIDRVSGLLHRARRLMRVVTIVSGLFLIVLGVLLFTNRLGWLSQWLPLFDLGL